MVSIVLRTVPKYEHILERDLPFQLVYSFAYPGDQGFQLFNLQFHQKAHVVIGPEQAFRFLNEIFFRHRRRYPLPFKKFQTPLAFSISRRYPIV